MSVSSNTFFQLSVNTAPEKALELVSFLPSNVNKKSLPLLFVAAQHNKIINSHDMVR